MRIQRQFFVPALTLIMLIIAAGCGPSGVDTTTLPQPEPSAEPPAATALPGQETQAPAPAQPAPTPAAAAPDQVEVLRDTSFESWSEGKPVFWQINRDAILAPGQDPLDGNRVLALTGHEEDWGVAYQYANLNEADRGKTLEVTAYGQAPVVGQLFLDITYKANEEDRHVRKNWQPTTEWTPLTVSLPLTEDVDLDSVRVGLLIRHGAQGKYLVDNLSVALLDE